MQRSSPPDQAKENPDSVGAETGVQGIEDLPRRVVRYSKAKAQSLEVAKYIDGRGPSHRALCDRVRSCGDYLIFRHYFTIDEVRLHGARLCMKHLLCPLCAIRRGAKAMKAYLDRWEVIQVDRPSLLPFLVTLTVKDGPDLAERFKHLFMSQHELWKRKHRGRGSVLDGVEGAVWSYEAKRGTGSGMWHPHLHMIALAETMLDAGQLSREWHEITGDSFIVDVRPISPEDPASGFIEVFKYAVKFSDQPNEDTWHCYETLKGKRLLGSAGCFRGVEVPEQLTDEALDGLPFVDLFYRYLDGAGYGLQGSSRGQQQPKPFKLHNKARAPDPSRPSYTPAEFRISYSAGQARKKADALRSKKGDGGIPPMSTLNAPMAPSSSGHRPMTRNASAVPNGPRSSA